MSSNLADHDDDIDLDNNADYLASTDDINDNGFMILIFPTQDKKSDLLLSPNQSNSNEEMLLFYFPIQSVHSGESHF